MRRDILHRLRSRHLLSESTLKNTKTLSDFLSGRKNVSAYLGIDPTGGGLHVGHLASLRALQEIERCEGVRPILLVGGATACVGDPSGKRSERPMLSLDDIRGNVEGIRKDLSLLSFESEPLIVNNADWWNNMSTLEFLRDVGRHFRANVMLQKESVKQRLSSGEGISFTEFSYQVLQGYDFLHLYENHDCVLQVGGSDQWGNITAGVNLVRRVKDEQVHGVTVPLLTTSQGEKFGKTAGNAIWLCPSRTSNYDFYQYFLRTEDNDVGKLLRIFTNLEDEDLNRIETSHQENPGARDAQRVLADSITREIRGEQGLENARNVTDALHGGIEALSRLSVSDLTQVFEKDRHLRIARSELSEMPIVELLARTGLVPSKSQAKKLTGSGGVYLNNHRVDDAKTKIKDSDLIGGNMLLLRKGKRESCLVEVN